MQYLLFLPFVSAGFQDLTDAVLETGIFDDSDYEGNGDNHVKPQRQIRRGFPQRPPIVPNDESGDNNWLLMGLGALALFLGFARK